MIAPAYVPDYGHLVWLDFDPTLGHEQGGRRPALVVSSRSYNEKPRLALVCPITSRVKGYPFEVPLPGGLSVTGVVLADQVRNVDWSARDVEFIEIATDDVMKSVNKKLRRMLPNICDP